MTSYLTYEPHQENLAYVWLEGETERYANNERIRAEALLIEARDNGDLAPVQNAHEWLTYYHYMRQGIDWPNHKGGSSCASEPHLNKS